MPRAVKIDTEWVKKKALVTIKQIENGELTTAQGQAIASLLNKRVEKLTDRVMCLRNMFNAEVNKQIQAEKTNYLRGTTPRTSNTKPISKYDKYKSTGNVQGMISEKVKRVSR